MHMMRENELLVPLVSVSAAKTYCKILNEHINISEIKIKM